MTSALVTAEVVSLRSSSSAFVTAIPTNDNLLSRWQRCAALSVTAIRIPIAVAALVFLVIDVAAIAALLFVAFAVVDLFDGIAARRVACDTAIRRSVDVLIDRTAIHSAALLCVMHFDVGLLVWIPFLLRDILQAIYSLRLLRAKSVVVVGPHWHMLYGIAMLVWGLSFMHAGQPDSVMTFVAAAASILTFADYVRRCKAIA